METSSHWERPRVLLGRCPFVESEVQIDVSTQRLTFFFPGPLGALAEICGQLGGP